MYNLMKFLNRNDSNDVRNKGDVTLHLDLFRATFYGAMTFKFETLGLLNCTSNYTSKQYVLLLLLNVNYETSRYTFMYNIMVYNLQCNLNSHRNH